MTMNNDVTRGLKYLQNIGTPKYNGPSSAKKSKKGPKEFSVQYKVYYYPHEKHRTPFLNATYALKDELDLLVDFRTTFLKSVTADAIYREIALEVRKIHPGFKGEGEWLKIYRKIARKNEIERQNFGSNFTLNGSGLESILTRHDRIVYLIITEYIDRGNLVQPLNEVRSLSNASESDPISPSIICSTINPSSSSSRNVSTHSHGSIRQPRQGASSTPLPPNRKNKRIDVRSS